MFIFEKRKIDLIYESFYTRKYFIRYRSMTSLSMYTCRTKVIRDANQLSSSEYPGS